MSSQAAPDRAAFRDFEHAAWERIAGGYAAHFDALVGQAVEPLLDAVGAGRGRRLLDVACGYGAVTHAAARRGCDVVGIDFSPVMVQMARARHAGPRPDALVVGDAAALPVASATFDAVSIGFGVLHFAEPERVFAEVRRVLRANGVFGFTVWADPSTPNVAYDIMLKAMAVHAAPAPIPAGPPFFRFADINECRQALGAAGFDTASVRLDILPLTWDLPAPDGVFEAFREGTARNAGMLEYQPPDRLERIRQAVADATARYRSGDRLVVPVAAALISCKAH